MRYLLLFLIGIGLIVLIFVLLLKNFSSSNVAPKKPLIDYATTNAVMQITISGPVVADQNHKEVQVTIGQTANQINIIQGYQGTIINTQTYQNNESAYAVFLRAIDSAGFTDGNSNPNLTDDRGFCAQGDTYNFEIINGPSTVQNYWATNCGSQGTFQGDVGLIMSLFQAQIPNYGTVTSNVSL